MKQLKKITILFLLPISVLAEEIEIPFGSDWYFRQANKGAWLPAEVPGTVHTDLLHNGKIDDPYFGNNSEKQQWIENEDWEYKFSFEVGANIITKDRIFIDFKGLDTFADVYLNDSLILEADNMFRSWQVNVDGILRSGSIELIVYFHSPLKKARQILENSKVFKNESVGKLTGEYFAGCIRKAAYHFGVDGGARFVTSGIWRPVVLKAWDVATIEDFSVQQKSLDEHMAKLVAQFRYHITRPFFGEVEIIVDGKSIKKSTVELQHGVQEDNIAFPIENPALWWPHGMGDQKIYEIEVMLKKDGKTLASRKIMTGLRNITLIGNNHRGAGGLQLNVNGKAVYLKGAEYTPQDYFLPRVSKAQYRDLLQSATNANINMLLVGGDGVYEADIFYQLCDELGLLVWQDFMIPNPIYPLNTGFLDNLKVEVTENAKRLRNHPSIALWSDGNYVIADSHGGSDIKENESDFMTEEGVAKLAKTREKLSRNILPEAIKSTATAVPFWDYAAGELKIALQRNTHNPIERSNKTKTIGSGGLVPGLSFPSFPTLKTIKAFSEEKDRNVLSTVIKSHQSPISGSDDVKTYLNELFKAPKDFESHLYLNQLLHAEALKVTVEANRLKIHDNIATFIGPLNDSWPSISCAGIDYYGGWKAAHYYTKRALEAILVSFEVNKEEIKIHAANDLLEDLRAELVVELLDMNGKKIFTEQKKIRLKPNSVDMIWKKLVGDLLKKQKKEEVYLRARIIDGEHIVAENTYLFVPFKNLKLEKSNIKYEFAEEGDKHYLELRSDKTAFGVHVEATDVGSKYSDNYFTLHAKELKRIEIYGNDSTFEISNNLIVRSLIDSYKP
jgi:beta-mannosidase